MELAYWVRFKRGYRDWIPAVTSSDDACPNRSFAIPGNEIYAEERDLEIGPLIEPPVSGE